jgi:hypothetical protein
MGVMGRRLLAGASLQRLTENVLGRMLAGGRR